MLSSIKLTVKRPYPESYQDTPAGQPAHRPSSIPHPQALANTQPHGPHPPFSKLPESADPQLYGDEEGAVRNQRSELRTRGLSARSNSPDLMRLKRVLLQIAVWEVFS